MAFNGGAAIGLPGPTTGLSSTATATTNSCNQSALISVNTMPSNATGACLATPTVVLLSPSPQQQQQQQQQQQVPQSMGNGPLLVCSPNLQPNNIINNNNNNNSSSNNGNLATGNNTMIVDGPHNNKRLCTRMDNNNDSGHINQNNTTLVGNSPNDEPRRKRHELARPNHILLFTIINPVYPITVEVLHTICNPYGQVQRIVIFKKNGVQAMVEFDSIDSATRARENLSGCDIYSGCCSLKIDFAKPEKLNVYKNDSDTSWDFTMSVKEVGNGRSPLLQDPMYGSRPQPFAAKTMTEPVARPNKPPLLGPGSSFPFVTPEFHQSSENWKQPATTPHTGIIKEAPIGGPTTRNTAVNFVPQGQAQGAVMMVYGLDAQISNTEKLFNLVCLYGNVARIKFLKTKEGTAMVQMGDSVAVERCVQHLNNIPVGTNGKLQIAFSKQNFLSEVTNPFSLPDHTPSFKEFTGSKNNRFLSPAQASKNRIQPPSKILHFFNTPPGLTEEQLIGIFNIKEVPPTAVRMFPLKTERSSSGLIEFPSVAQAVLAIMKCNHIPIESKGTKFPFIMKLCFSSSKSMNGTWTTEGGSEKMNGDN